MLRTINYGNCLIFTSSFAFVTKIKILMKFVANATKISYLKYCISLIFRILITLASDPVLKTSMVPRTVIRNC